MEVKKISGVIVLDYVHTSKSLADQFTKGLSRSVIDSASSEMELIPRKTVNSRHSPLCSCG
jgi:hypothetical protein